MLKEEIVFVWLELVQKAAQIQNVQEKNNLLYTMNLGWVTGCGRS